MAKGFVKPTVSEGFVSVLSCITDADADHALEKILFTHKNRIRTRS
jgi:hypothetical protein